MLSMRLTSAADIDSSKKEKASECVLKLYSITKNTLEEKGDKVKISLKMMELESFVKKEKV